MDLRYQTLPRVLIITGLMAAGKSSVAQALAERLPKAVHLRGDVFRKMVVSGRVEMTPEPSDEALLQLRARYDIAVSACGAYVSAGFTVIYQDVILGEFLSEIATRLAPFSPGVVVLTPALDVVAARDGARAKTAYNAAWTPHQLAVALNATPKIGKWLDTSNIGIAETVDAILNSQHELRRGCPSAVV